MIDFISWSRCTGGGFPAPSEFIHLFMRHLFVLVGEPTGMELTGRLFDVVHKFNRTEDG